MQTSTKTFIVVALLACILAAIYVYGSATNMWTPATQNTVATTTLESNVLSYGNVTLKLGEIAQFKNISIRPLSIEEDSRCPKDVECFQAGTVRVRVEVVSGMSTSTSIITLDKKFTTEGEAITLTVAMPNKISTVHIGSSDYELTFNVTPQSTPVTTNPSGKCYVGGCSSQLCSDTPDAVSTCEYREVYACYKTATCERQSSGQCGWTETTALTSCIANNS